MNTTEELNIENLIWIIYIFFSIGGIYSNELEKKYNMTKNKYYLENAHKINVIIFFIALLIYIYFTYKSYTNYKKNINSKLFLRSQYRLIGSILFLVGGVIFLYLESSKNIEEEIGIL